MDPGYFGPRSSTWAVSREPVLLLGGPRALLLQIAHPLVAQGVLDHSGFERDVVGRLWRTLDRTLQILFGSKEEAKGAIARVNAAHAKVNGTLREPAGRWAAGTRYDAFDPELSRWVWATLVDTTLAVYPRFVAPLARADLERAYQDSKTFARLFGVPAALLPESHEDFGAWMRATIASDDVAIGPQQRDLGRRILYPPLPVLPKALFEPSVALTASLLPEKIREGYGLALTPARRFLAEWSPPVVRRLLPLLPARLRRMPHASRAYRRVEAPQ